MGCATIVTYGIDIVIVRRRLEESRTVQINPQLKSSDWRARSRHGSAPAFAGGGL